MDLWAVITLFFKRISKIIILPFTKLKQKLRIFKNPSTVVTQATKNLVAKIRSLFVLKPKSKSEYFIWGNFLVYKKLVYLVIIIICAIPIIYFQLIAEPLPTEKTSTDVEKSSYTDFVFDDYKLSIFSGKAKIYNKSKTLIYKGDVAKGVCTGYGELTDKYGKLVYVGDFLDNQYSGTGSLYYPSGKIEYEGDFLENTYNGAGKIYDTKGNLVYSGEFENGLYQNAGILYQYKSNLTYEGTFDKGTFSGTGIIYDSNKNTLYEGGFENNLYQNEGKLYNNSGALIYDGIFDKGNYCGTGKLYDESSARLIYDGEFLDGKRHGQGIAYKNGRVYFEGVFFKDSIDYASLLSLKLSDASSALKSDFKTYTDKTTTGFTFSDFPILLLTNDQIDFTIKTQEPASDNSEATTQAEETNIAETSSAEIKEEVTSAKTEEAPAAPNDIVIDQDKVVINKIIVMDDFKTLQELDSLYPNQKLSENAEPFTFEDYAMYYSMNLGATSELLFNQLQGDIYELCGGNDNLKLYNVSYEVNDLIYTYKFLDKTQACIYYTVEEKQ